MVQRAVMADLTLTFRGASLASFGLSESRKFCADVSFK
jgi:hypothetical protein